MKYSKNVKLNTLLNKIEDELNGLGIDEVKRYYNEFRRLGGDYNIVMYGNLRIYYGDVRDLYKECGYKCDKWSNERVWTTYRNQVGYVARQMLNK